MVGTADRSPSYLLSRSSVPSFQTSIVDSPFSFILILSTMNWLFISGSVKLISMQKSILTGTGLPFLPNIVDTLRTVKEPLCRRGIYTLRSLLDQYSFLSGSLLHFQGLNHVSTSWRLFGPSLFIWRWPVELIEK